MKQRGRPGRPLESGASTTGLSEPPAEEGANPPLTFPTLRNLATQGQGQPRAATRGRKIEGLGGGGLSEGGARGELGIWERD